MWFGLGIRPRGYVLPREEWYCKGCESRKACKAGPNRNNARKQVERIGCAFQRIPIQSGRGDRSKKGRDQRLEVDRDIQAAHMRPENARQIHAPKSRNDATF